MVVGIGSVVPLCLLQGNTIMKFPIGKWASSSDNSRAESVEAPLLFPRYLVFTGKHLSWFDVNVRFGGQSFNRFFGNFIPVSSARPSKGCVLNKKLFLDFSCCWAASDPYSM